MTASPTPHPAGEYIATLARVLLGTIVTDAHGARVELDEAAAQTVELLLGVRRRGQKALLVGNGGSAAIVSHLHNDLTKAVGLRALVFNEQPLLTALANDEGYPRVFEMPVELWAEAGDLLLAISSSGRSENILRAARAARARGAKVITLSGFSPSNPLRELGDLNFYVESSHYGLVEQAHSVLTHYLSDAAAGAGLAIEPAGAQPDDAHPLAA